MKEENKNLTRPPIVVVMGHIDHGKTTLLDAIRKSDVAAKESGGITQHIGAYEVEHFQKGSSEAKKITFLDTPGHEAFSKMRSRGANVADTAILVVAADDGVKPQTKEALNAIKEAKIPYLVAINKIDKPNADLEKTKNNLATEEVFLEGRGGNVPFVEISAKEGIGIDQLLDTVLLMAELEDLKYNSGAFASGVVIESHLDKKRGINSTLLVKDGVLKKGEYAAAGEATAKIKIFENFRGEPIEKAEASSPVLVVGFDKLPEVGAEFRSFFTQKEAAEAARKSTDLKTKTQEPRAIFEPANNEGRVEPAKISLGVVIKSDVLGSAEAIKHELDKLNSDTVNIKILRADAGDVSEDDVKLASSSDPAIIVAFRVAVKFEVADLATRLGVQVKQFQIIYEVAGFLKEKIEALTPKETKRVLLGEAKILKIFSSDNPKKQIVGGKVLEGKISQNASFDILRRENKIGEGRVENLQSRKIKISEVLAPEEFGALASSQIALLAGDTIEIYLKS